VRQEKNKILANFSVANERGSPFFCSMKSIKIHFAFFLVFAPLVILAQTVSTNLFVRTPQVVNYNFNTSETTYTSVLSAGIGISHQAKLIEFATFITTDDIHGFYSFFGSSLKTKPLAENWTVYTNWYGEFTFLPNKRNFQRTLNMLLGSAFYSTAALIGERLVSHCASA